MVMAHTIPPLHLAGPLQWWELPAIGMLFRAQATAGFWLPAPLHCPRKGHSPSGALWETNLEVSGEGT